MSDEGKYNVNELCRHLEVSESGYYRWLRKPQRSDRDELLLVKIKTVINAIPENKNYGVERVQLALEQRGEQHSYSKVYRVMKKYGLVKKLKKHPNGITRADAATQKSENLLQRDFSAAAPNTKWLTDITEVQCADGKLYVAPVFDCFDGQIVGLEIGDNMRKELCIAAFENACRSQCAHGMILHSDRGSQYTSGAFREALSRHGAIQSMSSVGKCYDNARMESFFATLKKEKLYPMRTERYTMEYVKTVIFRYIMVYYNRQRVYTANPHGLPPAIYRNSILIQVA